MATPAGSNVWAERAAARQREATVSGGSTNSLNGGSLSQNGKGSGLVGKAVAPEDPGAVTEDRVEVLQESVGFIVGPKGSMINPIAQLTQTQIASPRKGEPPVFSIFGPRACAKAAAALIRVKAQESSELQSSRRPADRTDKCTVPESLVGFVMGKERSTVQHIAYMSRATIECPTRGAPPEFVITGPPLSVEAAVACIQAKIHQACNTWKQDEWWQQAQTHRRKAKLTRSVAYTALPSVVTWWGAKPRGRK